MATLLDHHCCVVLCGYPCVSVAVNVAFTPAATVTPAGPATAMIGWV